MLRDVFYYGKKPNVHPREKFATSLEDARQQSTTEHFWIINEYCDYRNFDWDFDFDFLPDEDVWAEAHINVWPSQHQKDSGTWLVNTDNTSSLIIYRADVDVVNRKKIKTDEWVELDSIDNSKFDFSWHPDPTDPPYIYKWGNKFAPVRFKPCLEYHTPGATQIKYMDQIAELLPNDCWVEVQQIDKDKFDMSWRPDPMEPPMIYIWGNKYVPAKTASTLEYHVPGATEKKFMPEKLTLVANMNNWDLLENVDKNNFDFAWIPDPTSPPYIYVWGNQWNKPEDKISIQYVVEGATEYKYMEARTTRKPCMDNWIVPANVDVSNFDFSWEPSPADPAFIYQFGTQWQKTNGPRYIVEDATEVKFVSTMSAKALPTKDNWTLPSNIDIADFDFSWHPDDTSPPYIYVFPTQWALSGGPIYTVDGATEIKYVEDMVAKAIPDKTNWEVPTYIDSESFDFSWHPYAQDEPYIYQFGTQWQKTGGPVYNTPGVHKNSAIKYIDTRIIKSKRLPSKRGFATLGNLQIKDFDYSWHPDTTDEPYIYVFGNNFYSGEFMPTIEYVVPGAKQIKYVHDIVATLAVDMTNWEVPENVDVTGIDFSWKPNPKDPPFIYQFGTQHQKTGGPRYVVPSATEVKYVEEPKAKAFASKDNWEVPTNIDVAEFDFSWHPDYSEPPYIYVFGTQWALTGGPKYIVPGATEVKYIDTIVAKAAPNRTHWSVPDDIDSTTFDFSWHPYAEDEPYIYQFGTQWQKTGGPIYMPPEADATCFTKYIDTRILKATKLPHKKYWSVAEGVKVAEFDYSWHHDETEEPYIYVFGNNLYSGEIMPTVIYTVPSATKTKYISTVLAKLANNMDNWDVPSNLDTSDFDFSWVPNPKEPAYIYQFGTQHQRTGGPRYIVPGATEVKYIDVKAKRLHTRDNWIVPDNIDESSIDFSWHPDDTESPYIYHFGTQWNNRGGPEYHVQGATELKYSSNIVGKTKKSKQGWKSLIQIEEDKFDYSWVPHPYDPPYIYVFGNQWNVAELEPTVEYVVEGATEKKYIHDIVATVAQRKHDWNILEDVESFDYSWRPNPTDPAYTYVFGNKQYPGNIMPTVTLTIEGATQEKFVDDIVATLAQDISKFTNTKLIKEFDYSWRPNPKDPPYIYQFGTQWAKTHGPQYIIEGATETKYVESVKAVIAPNMTHWEVPSGVNVSKFDFSWHPDANSPPYIYQFGTISDPSDGPRYVVPGATEVVNMERIEIVGNVFVDYPKYFIETTLEALIEQHKGEVFWALNNEIDYTNFDFNWRPDIQQAHYVHAFGSSESETTQTYFINSNMWVNGYRELNWVKDEKLDDQTLAKLFKKPDMFFVDKGNSEAQDRFDKLKQRFPTIQKTRYLNTWVDTINRCINRATTNLCWILNSELNYDHFDFEYYPNPWQMKMVHVFGTQWSHWGTTFMVNRETFTTDTKYVKIIEHLNNINFVKDRTAIATNILYDTVYIDHGNKPVPMNTLVIEYDESYLKTFKKLLEKLPNKKEHFVWVISSICDYNGFDFTYICDPFARDQLHVFPSDKQKFGDTFLVNVNKLRELIDNVEELKDIKVNYNQHMRVKRLPAPTIITEGDTHVSAIHIDFDFPYATFQTIDNQEIKVVDVEPMNLWSKETKTIQITSVGGTRIVVPKETRDHVKRELYDYPYIQTNKTLAKSTPMDIVFLSNGETGADENYEHLIRTTQGLSNRVVRVDGVNGRVQAYHAAAEASNTPWMFTVFAKLKVSNKFDWNWQPDRLQIPKHYVFHAKNPVNGLIYGHQAMIAYNKKLTLANKGKGLDFTMDDEHEVVEIVSGTANFNTDEWSTWRTSFREALKLRANNDEISKNRLEFWLTVGSGKFSQYSIDGAADAVDYYESVNGDFEKLKLSYDWPWLNQMFNKKYKK
jgi:hypothetical protein